jgi:hypothetical protein
MLTLAAVVLDVALLVFVAALVSCLVRRWSAATKLATLVAITGAAVSLFVVGWVVFARPASESVSRAVLPLVVTFAGLGLKAFARRRTR